MEGFVRIPHHDVAEAACGREIDDALVATSQPRASMPGERLSTS
jgi:hypothetical protein